MKKSLFYSFVAILSRSITGFLFLFVVARILEVKEFGTFTYSLVVSNLFALIVDYGYNTKLSKDTARNISQIGDMTLQTAITKVVLSGFTIVLLVIIGISGFWNKDEFLIISILTISAILNSFANHFLIPFRSVNKFNIEARHILVNNLTIFSSSLIIALLTKNIVYIAWAFLLFKITYLLTVLRRFKQYFGLCKVCPSVYNDLKTTLPYAIHIIIGSLYMNVDTVILKQYVGYHDIGIYQSGMRIIGAATMLMAIFNNVLIPRLSSISKNRNEVILIASKFNYIVMGLGALLGLVLVFFSTSVITIIYSSKFIELTKYMFLFAFIIFLRYAGVVYGTLLTISDRQKIRTIGVVITLIIIVLMDLIMIPKYQMWGALYTLIVAHILLNMVYVGFTFKDYKSFFLKIK